MAQFKFKEITTVQDADGWVNSLLSRLQRVTPTIVRRHYVISRIRKFYLDKIRFMQRECEEKFGRILEQFPMFDNLHPFYKELFDITYDRNHYKLALGQISALKSQISKVGNDYQKLVKYGDSLFRCKKLKKACLGRIVTLIKKQKKAFIFLEDVRQHLTRLPSIDPSLRTVMLAGCPNAGKSSFMNLVSTYKPEIQSYAFTTKCLAVGHFDYEYLRWQVLDSPGLLDRPIDEMNTIEMNSISALTHIDCAVIFFLDPSETCDITIESQLNILKSVRPLFKDRPFVLACNKSDLCSLEKLAKEEPEKRALIAKFEEEEIPVFEMSTATKSGVQELKNELCASMLKYNVARKKASQKVGSILNRIYVAEPPTDAPRYAKCIPRRVLEEHYQKKFYTKLTDDNPDMEFEKHIEEKEGYFYVTDYNKTKLLANPEENYDKIPMIKDGKNISDFIDIDIDKKMANLMKDEEERLDCGFYDDDESEALTEQDHTYIDAADKITDQIKINKINARLESGTGVATINRASRSRTKTRTTTGLRDTMEEFGVEMTDTKSGGFTGGKRKASKPPGARDGSQAPSKKMRLDVVAEKRARSKSVPRDEIGMPDPEDRKTMAKRYTKDMKKHQYAGKNTESHRAIVDLKPKHLFSGKRGSGTNQRR